jgi:hypothetical protein
MSIAKHYETGESLPEEVYLKLLAARTFRAGSLSLRQVSSFCWCYFFVSMFSVSIHFWYILLYYQCEFSIRFSFQFTCCDKWHTTFWFWFCIPNLSELSVT